jgi:Tol biopolymer transport system component
MMKLKILAFITWVLIGTSLSGCSSMKTEKISTPDGIRDIGQAIMVDNTLIFACHNMVERYDLDKKEMLTFTNDPTRVYSAIGLLEDKIYFLRTTDLKPKEFPAGGQFGPTQIFRMNLDGSNLEQVTNDGFFTFDLIALPPMGKLIFVSDRPRKKERYEVILLDPKVMEEKILAQSSNQITSVFWSPDGNMAAFFENIVDAQKTALFLLDIDNAKSKEILVDKKLLSDKLAWSPDGQQIVTGLMNGNKFGLGFIDVENSSLVKFIPVDNPPTNFAWSPDDKNIVFETKRSLSDRGDDFLANLWLLDIPSGKTKILHGGGLGWKTYSYNPVWSPDGEYIAFLNRVGISGSSGQQLKIQNIKTTEAFVSDLPCSYADRILWLTLP